MLFNFLLSVSSDLVPRYPLPIGTRIQPTIGTTLTLLPKKFTQTGILACKIRRSQKIIYNNNRVILAKSGRFIADQKSQTALVGLLEKSAVVKIGTNVDVWWNGRLYKTNEPCKIKLTKGNYISMDTFAKGTEKNFLRAKTIETIRLKTPDMLTIAKTNAMTVNPEAFNKFVWKIPKGESIEVGFLRKKLDGKLEITCKKSIQMQLIVNKKGLKYVKEDYF